MAKSPIMPHSFNHLEDGSAINIDNIGYGGQQEEMEQLSTDSEACSNADKVQQSRISRIFSSDTFSISVSPNAAMFILLSDDMG